MSEIQAILFDNRMYDTNKAREFLKRNHFRPIKRVHKTKNYLRYRLKDPDLFFRMRTKKIRPGVKFIIGFR